MEMPEVFKKHPWAVASVILVGGILLYLYWRSGSSSPGVDGTYGTGIDPQAAALNAQLQAASMNYNAQQDQLAAAKEVELAKVDALNQQTSAATLIAKYQTDTAMQAQLAGNQTAISIAGIQGNMAYQTAAMMANRDVSVASINAQVQSAQIQATLQGLMDTNKSQLTAHLSDNSTALDVAGINSSTAINLADIAANRDITINASNNQTEIYGLEVQHDLGLAKYNTDFLINRDNTNAAITINQQNTDAAITINGQNTGALVTINQQDNITKQLGITSQTELGLHYIDAAHDVANNQVNSDTQIALAQIGAVRDTQQGVIGLLKDGALGNANRASVAAALLGQPGVGVAIQQQQAVNGPTGTLAGVAGVITSIGGIAP